jgi:predicted RNase H-like HicB family nuclease
MEHFYCFFNLKDYYEPVFIFLIWKMNIPVIIYQDEDWVYIAESPVVEWFHTFWRTKEELFKNIEEVASLYKEMIKNKEFRLAK